MVDERGFADTAPGNDCNDVYLPVHPRGLQKSDILISAKNIASGNGQSGYRDFLRSKFSWRLASSDTRSGRLLQALASDSTSCIDSAGYRRYRLQQLIWALKAPRRIFLKQFCKQNYDRLRKASDLFKR